MLQDGLTLPGHESLLANFIILQTLLVRNGVAEKCFLTRNDDLVYCRFSCFDEKKIDKQSCKGNGVLKKISNTFGNAGKYQAPPADKKVNNSCLISDKPLPFG